MKNFSIKNNSNYLEKKEQILIKAPALFTNFYIRRHLKTHWLIMKIRLAIIIKNLDRFVKWG